MKTKINIGDKVWSLRLQKIVKVIYLDDDYALVEDEEGENHSTPIRQLETMDAHVENRLRLD